jgi:hypothetical protein
MIGGRRAQWTHPAGYQKKSCKSPLSRGFAPPPENRGVLDSIPSLAIRSFACSRTFCIDNEGVSEAAESGRF